MTDFERAMNAYYAHFNAPYPYAVGYGYKGASDEENIAIIRNAIATDTPVTFAPDYRNDVDY